MIIAARPLKSGTIKKHVTTPTTFLSTRNGNGSLTRGACSEERRGRMKKKKKKKKKTEMTVWHINITEEGASMCTESSFRWTSIRYE